MKARMLIIEIISGLFVLLWCYAAISKLSDFESFKDQISKSPFITDLVEVVTFLIPFFELFIVGLFFFQKTRLLGLYLSFFLMFLFSGYIYIMLNHSYYIPCSCGGVLDSMSWEQHLGFNIFFTLLGLIGIMMTDNNKESILNIKNLRKGQG